MPKRSSSPAMAEEQRLAKKNTNSGHGDDRGEEEVVLVGDEEEDEDLVLPGFRFHPTDEELVTFYLRRKVAGKRLSIEIIKDFDIYKHDPWDLPKASTISGEKELYFFCLRGRKYRNSIRPNRVTGSGFWKATGIDRPIHSAGDCIGLKKSLVFYRGSAGKGTKTEWMMHEFRLPPRSDAADASPSNQEAEVWTICRIFKRSITYKKQPQTQEQHVAAAAAAAATQPDSGSSVTAGSPESETSDEYMTSHSHIPAAPPAPVNNDDYGYGYNQQYHQEQWNSSAPPHPMATAAAAALPSPGTAAAFQYGALCSPTAAMNPYDLFYKDGCSWDDIGRMVMELTDPSEFYDGLTTQ